MHLVALANNLADDPTGCMGLSTLGESPAPLLTDALYTLTSPRPLPGPLLPPCPWRNVVWKVSEPLTTQATEKPNKRPGFLKKKKSRTCYKHMLGMMTG